MARCRLGAKGFCSGRAGTFGGPLRSPVVLCPGPCGDLPSCSLPGCLCIEPGEGLSAREGSLCQHKPLVCARFPCPSGRCECQLRAAIEGCLNREGWALDLPFSLDFSTLQRSQCRREAQNCELHTKCLYGNGVGSAEGSALHAKQLLGRELFILSIPPGRCCLAPLANYSQILSCH